MSIKSGINLIIGVILITLFLFSLYASENKSKTINSSVSEKQENPIIYDVGFIDPKGQKYKAKIDLKRLQEYKISSVESGCGCIQILDWQQNFSIEKSLELSLRFKPGSNPLIEQSLFFTMVDTKSDHKVVIPVVIKGARKGLWPIDREFTCQNLCDKRGRTIYLLSNGVGSNITTNCEKLPIIAQVGSIKPQKRPASYLIGIDIAPKMKNESQRFSGRIKFKSTITSDARCQIKASGSIGTSYHISPKAIIIRNPTSMKWTGISLVKNVDGKTLKVDPKHAELRCNTLEVRKANDGVNTWKVRAINDFSSSHKVPVRIGEATILVNGLEVCLAKVAILYGG